jgi:hypothetical protein
MLPLALLMPPTTDTTVVKRITMGRRPSYTHSDTICNTNRVMGLMTTVALGHRAAMARSVAMTRKVPETPAVQAARWQLVGCYSMRRGEAVEALATQVLRNAPRPRRFEHVGASLRSSKPTKGLETSIIGQPSASRVESGTESLRPPEAQTSNGLARAGRHRTQPG